MAVATVKRKNQVLPASGTTERANTRGHDTKRTSRKGGPMQRQYVGIDLHRRRSVIVRMDGDGEKLSTVKIENDPVALGLALAEAGPDPEVAIEACYGWVRHEAPYDRVGCRAPPAACRSRPLKLEAA
jgi:hypothetical protein